MSPFVGVHKHHLRWFIQNLKDGKVIIVPNHNWNENSVLREQRAITHKKLHGEKRPLQEETIRDLENISSQMHCSQ